MPPQNDLLTDEQWFLRGAFNLIDHTLHDRIPAAREAERALVGRMALYFLEKKRKNPDYEHNDILSFFGFCERNIDRSRAQILQDLWVLYMLGEKNGGFFVEFGACDGLSLSNTHLLEEHYGWTGILAEPNHSWHEALAANRTARISHACVADVSGAKVEFLATDEMPELSRMADIVPNDIHERNGNRAKASRYQVPSISLLDLLREHDAPPVIDYLSVDTEGSEFEILSAFDFDAYRFRLITVEHAGEQIKREKIKELLHSKGYSRWIPLLTRWDDWYVGEL